MVFLTLNCNIFVGLKCKLKKDDLPKYGMIPSRWKSCKSDQNWVSFIIPFDHYLSSCVWHNSLIKIDNRPIFYNFMVLWRSWKCHSFNERFDQVHFSSRVWRTLRYQFSCFSRRDICMKISKTIKYRLSSEQKQNLWRFSWTVLKNWEGNSVLSEVKKNGLMTAS